MKARPGLLLLSSAAPEKVGHFALGFPTCLLTAEEEYKRKTWVVIMGLEVQAALTDSALGPLSMT